MTLTFLLSGSCLTRKIAHGLGWGPLVLPPLSGETCWVHDPVEGAGEEEGRRSRGDGVAVSRGNQERFPGQWESWMKGKERVAGREGASLWGRTPGARKVAVCS